MDYNLPKPFRAKNVTNGNANEIVTNFLIKTGSRICNLEEDYPENHITKYHMDYMDYLLKSNIDDYNRINMDMSYIGGRVQRLIYDKNIGSIFMSFKYIIPTTPTESKIFKV